VEEAKEVREKYEKGWEGLDVKWEAEE